MSDSKKKYEELKEEGKIKGSSLNAGSGLFGYRNPETPIFGDTDIPKLMKEYHYGNVQEVNTGMSDYFVTKFLDWLKEKYLILKK